MESKSSSSSPLALDSSFSLKDPVWVHRQDETLEGIVEYLGPVSFAQGDDWVGVRLTGSAVGRGKNNGTVHGRHYFSAHANCGLFVRKSVLKKRSLHNKLEELRLKRELESPFSAASGSPPRTPGTSSPKHPSRHEEESPSSGKIRSSPLSAVSSHVMHTPLEQNISTASSDNELDLLLHDDFVSPNKSLAESAPLLQERGDDDKKAKDAHIPKVSPDSSTPNHDFPARQQASPVKSKNEVPEEKETAIAKTTKQQASPGISKNGGSVPVTIEQEQPEDALDCRPTPPVLVNGTPVAEEEETTMWTMMEPERPVTAASVPSRNSPCLDQQHDETSLSVDQGLVALLLAATSLLILLFLIGWIVWKQPLCIVPADNSSLGIAWLVMLLSTHVLTGLILLLPLCMNCCSCRRQAARIQPLAVYTSRLAALTTAVTSLLLLLLTLYFLPHKDWFNEALPLLIMSASMLLLACMSLMVSFWPTLGRRDMGHRNERAGANQEVAPLLQENQHEYHLMMTEEHDIEAPPVTDEPTTVPTTSRLRGTRRLLQLAAPQVLYLYLGCAVLLVRLPFSLAIPHFVSTTLSALARVEFGRARHEIVYLLVLGSIDAALDFWCVFLFGYANQRIIKGVRLDLFSRILQMEVAFFDVNNSGTLSSRLSSDCSEMAGDLTWFFRFSIESVVRCVGIALYMLIRSPRLGACALSIVPVVAVINKAYGDWLSKNAIAVQDALAAANAVAQEALANVRTVIAFAAEEIEQERYQEKVERQYRLNIQQLFMQGVYYMAVSTFLINTIVQAALLWIGAHLIERGQLNAEVLLAFMLYQGQLQNETLNLFQSYSSLIKSSGAGDKVFALLDRISPAPAMGSDAVQHVCERTVNREDEASREVSPYHLCLEQVTFRYPSRPERIVLDGMNLKIPKGSTVALVGPSGCGKSTIINLLQRFYDPSQGRILVNDRDLRQIDLREHRHYIGVVTQDCVLFDGTILENITYGVGHNIVDGPDASRIRQEAIQAARLAHADVFVESFPDGYDTPVGERGLGLSGGQKQRIAIARAIFRKPSLLLLDEATSALDAQSEQVVQKALDELLQRNQNMTTVIIAHRLKTVRKADYIAVLDHGRIAEWGSHTVLLQRRQGLYRSMVERASTSGLLPEHGQNP